MTGSRAGEGARSPDDERWRAAHRAVLDHLLRLVAEYSPLGEDLVLRGSMVMSAWVGAEAREPADLDWIVPLPLLVPVDPAHPYPYVDGLESVQQWPEAADGAGRYEIWRFEEFDTGGLRPMVPPDGLHWVFEAEPEERPPHLALLDLVRERPVAAPGVVLDVNGARPDGIWTYVEYETPGVRLTIPWAAEGLPPGEARLDFARDEPLPELPVWTAIPRADGSGRTVVRTPGPALSLAWKLLWLHTDCATEGHARAKDLHDAVLLAEAEVTRLSPRLLHKVFRRAPGAGTPAYADALRVDTLVLDAEDWADFRTAHPRVRGTAEEWVERLGRALERVPAPPAARRKGRGRAAGAS
ncbi:MULTISPECIES: nucleotidyl transferase AbiEii/AbiGii toxin family protein [Streptomyces]|uniref:Nucleotidyl transferase AbiEii/AbiGii toxin family protein n=1 Tax=Streptomyces caniscabiei TaxID=2746961 RepID=A0ABU4MRY7_9ACTN|nr:MULTISPECIES: nucleotidyl transferase AbiEii/AbiGii toxin family protein [Streptomyces]MBE4737851.1 nucleotidyl transferase AbiEii/AbiGii toxin family protein [Streptomyces caniscabiei]MBE4757350.1 nucleotidyl transferase AbiEii/AbiGii toxin family protein [Streptomyces caniscabiei]MBE4769349.1 nucleotidyl transferase AbiEii/AbiGii toxin family protein [Streptomyces caniscabiei]MBE4784930.1 nucleotidyl transferase AbiEii/AbiGii toxin family protein [Streptomyces caniscabiei]MBE4795714.1 nuc